VARGAVPLLPDRRRPPDEQERRVVELFERTEGELLVLARYMQILSDDACRYFDGRAINIHHSFLPSFKGAKPYHQAYDRGVKIIGATAHYVTGDLDEGPIIEQDVARVDHSMPPEELASIGSDLESIVLYRAVRWHADPAARVPRENGAATTDWFRNTTWNDAVASEFEAKLHRALQGTVPPDPGQWPARIRQSRCSCWSDTSGSKTTSITRRLTSIVRPRCSPPAGSRRRSKRTRLRSLGRRV
jgi:folate-dependent phosphoribosylglycinamide formyltransferase PurN